MELTLIRESDGNLLTSFGRHADVTEWKVLVIFSDVSSLVFTFSKTEKKSSKTTRFIC